MQSLNLLQPGHLMEYKCLLPVSNLARLSPLMSSPLMLFLKRKKLDFGRGSVFPACLGLSIWSPRGSSKG